MTGYESKRAMAQDKLAQPEQEPVALVIDGVLVKSALPEKYTGHLYTTPPQRKPLTDDEVVEALGNVRESITGNVFLAFARAIEAKLKERNA